MASRKALIVRLNSLYISGNLQATHKTNVIINYCITGDISKCLMSQNKNYSYYKYDFLCNNKFKKYDIRPFYSTNNLLFGIKVKWLQCVNNITLHSALQSKKLGQTKVIRLSLRSHLVIQSQYLTYIVRLWSLCIRHYIMHSAKASCIILMSHA